MVGKRQHRAIVKFWLGTGSDGGGTIKRGEHSDPGIYIHFLINLYWPFHRGLRGWLKRGGGSPGITLHILKIVLFYLYPPFRISRLCFIIQRGLKDI